MRFVTFSQNGRVRAGLLLGDADHPEDTVLDLAHPGYADALQGTPPSLLAMIKSDLAACATRLASVDPPEASRLQLGTVELQAPLPDPPRIFGIAHNYICALEERGMARPEAPVVFVKEPSCVVGPGTDVVLPSSVGGCTYEAELAAVIGRQCRDVGPDTALSYVAGYMNFNDVSASELIRQDGKFLRGKNFPTFGPCGPFLAAVDEIPDPQALDVTLEVDGVVRQRGTTRQMLFDVASLVSFLSRSTELRPGDVIATGTPAGVAPMQKPPTWLRAGDRVAMSVTGLGTLINTIVAKETVDA